MELFSDKPGDEGLPGAERRLAMIAVMITTTMAVFDGTIVNVVRGRSFDVRFTGTRTITEHYVRKGAEYVRVPGKEEEMNESVIPTC